MSFGCGIKRPFYVRQGVQFARCSVNIACFARSQSGVCRFCLITPPAHPSSHYYQQATTRVVLARAICFCERSIPATHLVVSMTARPDHPERYVYALIPALSPYNVAPTFTACGCERFRNGRGWWGVLMRRYRQRKLVTCSCLRGLCGLQVIVSCHRQLEQFSFPDADHDGFSNSLMIIRLLSFYQFFISITIRSFSACVFCCQECVPPRMSFRWLVRLLSGYRQLMRKKKYPRCSKLSGPQT